MFDAGEIPWLALLGLMGGWLGGLMGVGGSLIIIPSLVLIFGPERQHLYQAAAMIVNVFVVLPSIRQHRRAGVMLAPVLRWTVPTAALAALFGVYVSNRRLFHGTGQGFLQIIFGCFLAYIVLYHLLRLYTRQSLPEMTEDDARRISRWKLAGLVGLPTGFVAGLLGIGGGALAVPAQQIALRMPLRRAIGNSAGPVLLCSIIGATAKNATLFQHGINVWYSIGLAAILIPSAFLGAWIGSALVHRWPRGVIRGIFIILMTYGAVELIVAGSRLAFGESPSQTWQGL
jgi:uncharacterized membrane protein YfcA